MTKLREARARKEKEATQDAAERSVHKKVGRVSNTKHASNVQRWAEMDSRRARQRREAKAKVEHEASLREAMQLISTRNSIQLPDEQRSDVFGRLHVVPPRRRPQQRSNRRRMMTQSAPRERPSGSYSSWGPPKIEQRRKRISMDTSSIPSSTPRAKHSMQSWSVDTVVEWLGVVNMAAYQPVFRARSVNGVGLAKLGANGRAGSMAAAKLGIEPGHQIKMIGLVKRELKYATFSARGQRPASASGDQPWLERAAGGSPPPSPRRPRSPSPPRPIVATSSRQLKTMAAVGCWQQA